MYRVLLMMALAVFSLNTTALDFSRLGGTFTMDGDIKSGDFANFLIYLGTWEDPPTVFHITSKGGNLDEAIKIGEIIRASQIPVWSGSECYSACIFIYVSGVEREARGPIGLHRPYFEKAYFAGLTSMEAKEKYDVLKAESVTYLKNMEVSQSLIERIFQTSSDNVDLIPAKEANKLFGTQSPFYEEWLAAKCGKYTEEQSKVLSSWSSLRAARATIAVAQDESIPKAENYGSNIQELMSKAQLALQMEKAGMLEPYIELSEIHAKCHQKAVNAHVYGFHRSIQKYLLDLANENEPNKQSQ